MTTQDSMLDDLVELIDYYSTLLEVIGNEQDSNEMLMKILRTGESGE